MRWGGLISLRNCIPADPAATKGGCRQDCLPHICFLLIALSSSACAADWVRVASPQIEVITDAGEKSGRDLLSRFETIRAVFHDAGVADNALPVRAFAFASEREFHRYHEGAITEGFHRGGDRDYIAMFVGSNAARVAMHEYVHVVLSHSKIALPPWFEEGTAEFYSNAVVAGRKLSVGEPIEGRLAILKSEPWLNAAQMAAKPSGPKTQPIFYAESWALVHMLNLAPAWRNGMPRFILLLSEGDADGRKLEMAFQEAFGKTIDEALSNLRVYVPSIRAAALSTEPGNPFALAATIRVQQLTPLESAIARAELALHVDRPALARSLVEKEAQAQLKQTPESAEVAAALGGIDLAENHPVEARKHFEKAIELASRDAEMWFQYATLERESGATYRRFNELLEKVISFDPNFAEAQFLLGERQTDDGDFVGAIAHLRKALDSRPRESYYWHALGFAQVKAGLKEDALASARRAKATAATDPQEAMADALIAAAREPARLAREIPQESKSASAGKSPDVITPSSWQDPKGDARVEGVMIQVDCEKGFARLHVMDSAGKTIALEVHHPDRVRLVRSPGPSQDQPYSFPCGPSRMSVAIEYMAANAEVTSIKFRP